MPETLSQDNPLVIVGEENAVSGFKALGFRVYPVKEKTDLRNIFDELMQDKPAICLIQEDFYISVQNQIDTFRNLELPVFIPFARDTKMPLLEAIVKNIRLRATGRN